VQSQQKIVAEKVQLTLIGSPLCAFHFQWA